LIGFGGTTEVMPLHKAKEFPFLEATRRKSFHGDGFG